LEAIDTKATRKRIVDRILALAEDPRPDGCQRLSGSPRFRIRQGPYRVVYEVDDVERTVIVFKVGHRRDVYRR